MGSSHQGCGWHLSLYSAVFDTFSPGHLSWACYLAAGSFALGYIPCSMHVVLLMLTSQETQVRGMCFVHSCIGSDVFLVIGSFLSLLPGVLSLLPALFSYGVIECACSPFFCRSGLRVYQSEYSLWLIFSSQVSRQPLHANCAGCQHQHAT